MTSSSIIKLLFVVVAIIGFAQAKNLNPNNIINFLPYPNTYNFCDGPLSGIGFSLYIGKCATSTIYGSLLATNNGNLIAVATFTDSACQDATGSVFTFGLDQCASNHFNGFTYYQATQSKSNLPSDTVVATYYAADCKTVQATAYMTNGTVIVNGPGSNAPTSQYMCSENNVPSIEYCLTWDNCETYSIASTCSRSSKIPINFIPYANTYNYCEGEIEGAGFSLYLDKCGPNPIYGSLLATYSNELVVVATFADDICQNNTGEVFSFSLDQCTSNRFNGFTDYMVTQNKTVIPSDSVVETFYNADCKSVKSTTYMTNGTTIVNGFGSNAPTSEFSCSENNIPYIQYCLTDDNCQSFSISSTCSIKSKYTTIEFIATSIVAVQAAINIKNPINFVPYPNTYNFCDGEVGGAGFSLYLDKCATNTIYGSLLATNSGDMVAVATFTDDSCQDMTGEVFTFALDQCSSSSHFFGFTNYMPTQSNVKLPTDSILITYYAADCKTVQSTSFMTNDTIIIAPVGSNPSTSQYMCMDNNIPYLEYCESSFNCQTYSISSTCSSSSKHTTVQCI
eukprot:gene13399-15779_t